MLHLRGILFDVDGTLVESNDGHAQAWVKALAEHGIHRSFEEVRRLIGMGADKLLPEVAGIRADTPEGKRISRRRKDIFRTKFLPWVRPQPGAKDLLEHLHSRGLRLGVASSADREELEALLEVCGADEFIESSASADDASASKPDPDIVHAALHQIGLSPSQVIMIGDTPYDVEAGQRADVPVVALRCGVWGHSDLEGAVAIYDDPADLLLHVNASPLSG